MNSRAKIRGIAAAFVLLVLSSLIAFLLYRLPPNQKTQIFDRILKHSDYLLLGVLGVIAIVGFAVDTLVRLFIQPLKRLSEETRLINSVNPEHRVKPEGSQSVRQLGHAINEVAERFESLLRDDQEDLSLIKAEAEHERNVLAAVLAELPQGIIICNLGGDILLYNVQAKRLFAGRPAPSTVPGETPPDRAFIGLGRSVYDILDRNQITHALEEIASNYDRRKKHAAADFATVSRFAALLRVEMVPVLNNDKALTGFILIISDITRRAAANGKTVAHLQSLSRRIRASSAGIRATVETVLDYPDMPPDQLRKFLEIIYNEARSLGQIVDDSDKNRLEPAEDWPRTPVRAAALAAKIASRVGRADMLDVKVTAASDDFKINVDTYAFTLAVLFLLKQIQAATGNVDLEVEIHRNDSYAHIDIVWSGAHLPGNRLREWGDLPLTVSGESLTFTLSEVLHYHQAEMFAFKRNDLTAASTLRIFLPVCDASAETAPRTAAVLPRSRPEFFDFDLFSTSIAHSDMTDRRLNELPFTVFDTETTGLDPDGGDEIIAIGAVRIVNGRLLQDERYERLVNPGRSIPQHSIAIHGIDERMVADSPPIATVLPEFHRFAANTVLIAHNAAFDMRMLQLKERHTGLTFTNPVLDTLLLSAVVHPAQRDHTLEAIADRLGVTVVGRHSAIGDALTAGRLFLKMIPLLAQKDIRTLRQAIDASRKTHYARITY